MRIAILLYPGVTALDAVGPYEVLGRVPGAQLTFVATAAGTVATDIGLLTLGAGASLDDLPSPDVIMVPGGVEGALDAAADPRIQEWLRTASLRAAWVASVCTGALILGAAGLLLGRRATTHWLARDQLARFGATFEDARVVIDGPVVTSQGVSAGIDMALTLAGKIADVETAEAIQLALEYDPAPPFDSGSFAAASAATIARARALLLPSA